MNSIFLTNLVEDVVDFLLEGGEGVVVLRLEPLVFSLGPKGLG